MCVSKIRENIIQQFENKVLLLSVHHKSQIELNFRGNPTQFVPSPRESRDISFHPRGNPATLVSIPAGFPRDFRDPHSRAGLYLVGVGSRQCRLFGVVERTD